VPVDDPSRKRTMQLTLPAYAIKHHSLFFLPFRFLLQSRVPVDDPSRKRTMQLTANILQMCGRDAAAVAPYRKRHFFAFLCQVGDVSTLVTFMCVFFLLTHPLTQSLTHLLFHSLTHSFTR
jgi:hypothetical protein